MKMTKELATNLMNCLTQLAISANLSYGNVPSEEDLELVMLYARQKFLKLTSEWEEMFGEEWEIIDPIWGKDDPEEVAELIIEICG